MASSEKVFVRGAGGRIPTQTDLLERARDLIPHLRERAMDAARQRRVSDETVALYKSAGLLRILQPPAYGGYAYGQPLFVDVVETLASACGSAGWVYAVLAAHQRLLAFFPPEVQDAVWGRDSETLACSAFAPTGIAERVAGGYRLSGRFPYSSACDFAQWAIVGGRIMGETAKYSFIVPTEKLQIVDDWDTVGLAGTGSKTLVGENIFVPPAFVQRTTFFEGTTGPVGLCAAAVGMARGLIDCFIDTYGRKVSPARGGSLLDSESMQSKIAMSMAEVDGASLLLRRDIKATDEALAAGNELPLAIQARNRRNQGFAGHQAMQAAHRLFSDAGASAAFTSSRLHQLYLDVRVATLHISLNWDVAARQSMRMLYDPSYETNA